MKNLLITLGDSWTEGVGAYPNGYTPPGYSGRERIPDRAIDTLYYKYKVKEYQNLHCWPKLLADSLECDLINLGFGGSSNQGMAKRFYNYINQTKLEEIQKYNNVMVITLLSHPARYSFWSDGHIKDFGNGVPLSNYLVEAVHLQEEDQWRDTNFYLDTIETLCKEKNFLFLYGTAFVSIKFLNSIRNSNNNNLNSLLGIESFSSILAPEEIAVCGHPNVMGYQKMANIMYTPIKRYLKNAS